MSRLVVEKLTFPMVYGPFRLVQTLRGILNGLFIVLMSQGVPLILTGRRPGGWTWIAMRPVYVQGLHILREPSDALAVTCDNPVSVLLVYDISTWILIWASTTHLAS